MCFYNFSSSLITFLILTLFFYLLPLSFVCCFNEAIYKQIAGRNRNIYLNMAFVFTSLSHTCFSL